MEKFLSKLVIILVLIGMLLFGFGEIQAQDIHHVTVDIDSIEYELIEHTTSKINEVESVELCIKGRRFFLHPRVHYYITIKEDSLVIEEVFNDRLITIKL